jgi:hypothetical protein
MQKETQRNLIVSSPERRTYRNVKLENRFSESLVKFKCLRMTVTDQNCIQEEIKFGECLLPFSLKSFAFSSGIKKRKG